MMISNEHDEAMKEWRKTILSEKVWYTGSYDKDADKSSINFHILREHRDGSTTKLSFEGKIK